MIDLCYIPCGQPQNGCPLFLYPGSRQGELPVRTKNIPPLPGTTQTPCPGRAGFFKEKQYDGAQIPPRGDAKTENRFVK